MKGLTDMKKRAPITIEGRNSVEDRAQKATTTADETSHFAASTKNMVIFGEKGDFLCNGAKLLRCRC
ncbi:hypothetical protein GS8_1688 [Geobacillus stearothermophilus]|uniref:Uncharacterized protein n=1 Tax=Geobacillus stearothermophilus TaxID=1422 RepID=A0A150N324_GEOSE|nr:hypothetical protein GS8_1688 [Geobacillus stearothermophilus]KYD27159.1 hypothetical protein B4109_0529 [Geobacillus stearothermophilus]KYD31119.1 hypothetical protein B4114_0582 [Geobacillus stearothermophilus]